MEKQDEQDFLYFILCILLIHVLRDSMSFRFTEPSQVQVQLLGTKGPLRLDVQRNQTQQHENHQN